MLSSLSVCFSLIAHRTSHSLSHTYLTLCISVPSLPTYLPTPSIVINEGARTGGNFDDDTIRAFNEAINFGLHGVTSIPFVVGMCQSKVAYKRARNMARNAGFLGGLFSLGQAWSNRRHKMSWIVPVLAFRALSLFLMGCSFSCLSKEALEEVLTAWEERRRTVRCCGEFSFSSFYETDQVVLDSGNESTARTA